MPRIKIETLLEDLEEILGCLESDEIHLDESMALYKKAVKISEKIMTKIHDMDESFVVLSKEAERVVLMSRDKDGSKKFD